MTIRQEEKSIIDEFSMVTDWMDKYEYIIELGKNLPIIEAKEKVDSNLIKGCQSRVWLQCNYSDRKLFFKADSDAIITKGIISLLIRVYSGHTPQEILDSDVSFIDEIGLKENLSPTRANGLVSMIKQIHLYALAYREQEKQS